MNALSNIAQRNPLAAIAQQTNSIALQIMLDPEALATAKGMAASMSQAKGFVPPHLDGNSHACFAVVITALSARMNPYAVACGTYQTPGGKVGFEGKLVQAMLENSGHLEGGIKYVYYGDWDKIQGKFKRLKGEKDAKNRDGSTYKKAYDFMAPDWKDDDEMGVGVTVTAQVKGEAEPRTMSFDLRQAHPRNSTLWATDPKTQLGYAAVRRFASTAMPGIFMGLPAETSSGFLTDTTTEPRPVRGGPAVAETVVEDTAADEAESEEVQREIDRRLRAEAEAEPEEVGDDDAGQAEDTAAGSQQADNEDGLDIPAGLKAKAPAAEPATAAQTAEPAKTAAAKPVEPTKAKAPEKQPERWNYEGVIKNVVGGIVKAKTAAEIDKVVTTYKDALHDMENDRPAEFTALKAQVSKKREAIGGK